jgi:hypothetical protein
MENSKELARDKQRTRGNLEGKGGTDTSLYTGKFIFLLWKIARPPFQIAHGGFQNGTLYPHA